MEAHPTFSIERSKQLNNMGMSGALSSSLSILPIPPEEMFPKLPQSKLDFVEQELMTRPFTHSSYLNSGGVVGHIFSSSPGYSTDLHHSSLSPDEKHSTNAHLISQSSTNITQFPLSYSSNTGPPASATPSHYSKENSVSWHTDSLPGFLDFPENGSIDNNPVESSACPIMASEEYSKQNDWQEWAERLISDDDTLTTNWNDLLADNIQDLEPKVKFFIIQINISFQRKLISNLFKKCARISFYCFRGHSKFQNHFHRFQDINPKVINNFLLHMERIALVLPSLPQQILLLLSHECVGHQNFMRRLWRLSTNLGGVKVRSSFFPLFVKSLALVC